MLARTMKVIYISPDWLKGETAFVTWHSLELGFFAKNTLVNGNGQN